MGQTLSCDNAASKSEENEIRGGGNTQEDVGNVGNVEQLRITEHQSGPLADENQNIDNGETSPTAGREEPRTLHDAAQDTETEQSEEENTEVLQAAQQAVQETVQEAAQELELSEVEFVEPEEKSEAELKAEQAAREAAREALRSASKPQEVIESLAAPTQIPASVPQLAPLAVTSDQQKLIDEFLKKNKYKDIHFQKIKSGCGKSADYPLHTAAKQNNEQVVKALLVAGADKTKLNHQKKTAQQLTKKGSPIWNLLA